MDLFDISCLCGIALILFFGGVAALAHTFIKATVQCIKAIFS